MSLQMLDPHTHCLAIVIYIDFVLGQTKLICCCSDLPVQFLKKKIKCACAVSTPYQILWNLLDLHHSPAAEKHKMAGHLWQAFAYLIVTLLSSFTRFLAH